MLILLWNLQLAKIKYISTLHSLQIISLILSSVIYLAIKAYEMSMEATNPVVLLNSVNLNLSPEAIAELKGMPLDEENLSLLETNDSLKSIIINDEDEDWFQTHPSVASEKIPRLSSGGKNIKAMLKSLRSPSPTSSTTSVLPSTAAVDSDEDWSKLIDEEKQQRVAEEARRTEWCRRAAGGAAMAKNKLSKARELVTSLKGEKKSLRNQIEALRVQLRVLEEQENVLDKRKHSALQSIKKYESLVVKFEEMNI